MQTKTRNGRKNNGRKAATPDLMSTLKRGPGRPKARKSAPTADEIAAELEAHAKDLKAVAAILRGKA
jgi:hypothetical protein